MPEIHELLLASIEVGTDRARPLDPLVVEGLAGSIREQGLLQSIVVHAIDDQPDRYRLVAGWHRLEAVRSLGRDRIMVQVLPIAGDDEAKLAEVMENLGRSELIALDRCQHLFELKQVWERMYPEAKNGGDPATKAAMAARRQSLPSGEDAQQVFGFSEAVAERIGLSARSIRLAVKIWTCLAPQTRQRLRGTDLARKQTELKALSEIPTPRRQQQVLDAILDPELADIGNVAQALDYLSEGVVPDPLEKRFETVRKSILSLDDDTFDSVIAACEDRIIESLKRRGRI